MKRITSLLLALIMCLSLVACGAPDRQPAMDAFNKTSAAFNEIGAVINADPGAYDQEVIDTMVEMANLLNQYKEILEGDNDLSEEDLDNMIAWFGTVDEWIADVNAELGN